jgi:hypothetical protein
MLFGNISEERTVSIFRVEAKQLTSGALVNFYWTTRRHIPEDGNLHVYSCESLKSSMIRLTLLTVITDDVIRE